jgi:hypothetical protein
LFRPDPKRMGGPGCDTVNDCRRMRSRAAHVFTGRRPSAGASEGERHRLSWQIISASVEAVQ